MLYSDITPRITAYADRRLLTRIATNNILGQFGQVRPLPQKNSQTIKFRRYNKLSNATTPLSEGITPTGKTLTKTDVSVTLKQYGDWVGITDVIGDTHQDPVLNESIDILGLQADETIDVLRAGVLKAGTSVFYAPTSAIVSRATTLDIFTTATWRTVARLLMAQEAKFQTSYVSPTPDIGTLPIAPTYPVATHTDALPDLEGMTGFVQTQQYPSQSSMFNGELGAFGKFRYVGDNNLTPFADAGGAASTNSCLSTTGTNCDIYPMLVFGKDAYGVVPLAGKNAVSTYVVNVKATKSDPLAQRGSVAWKTWNATVILQELWMYRLETALKG